MFEYNLVTTKLAINLLTQSQNNLTATLAGLGLLGNGETINTLKQKFDLIIKAAFVEQEKLSGKVYIIDEKVQQSNEKLELAVSHNTTEQERLLNLKKEQGELQIAVRTLEDKKKIFGSDGNGKKADIQNEIVAIKDNIKKTESDIKQIEQVITDGVNLIARYGSLLDQANTAQANANYHNQFAQRWDIVGYGKKRTRWGKVKNEAVYGWVTNQEQVNLRDQYQNQANQLTADANSIQGKVDDFNKNKSTLQANKDSKNTELWLYIHELDAKQNLLLFVGTQSDNELALVDLQIEQAKEDLQQLQITEIPNQEKAVERTNQRVTQGQSELDRLRSDKGSAQKDLDTFVKDNQELLATDLSLGLLKDAIAKVQGTIASLQGDLAKPNQSVDVINGLNKQIGVEQGKLVQLKQQSQLLALEELEVNQERLESLNGQLASEVSVNGGVKINTIEGYVILVPQLVQQLTGLSDIWVGNLKENHRFTVEVNDLFQKDIAAFESLTDYIGDNLADPYEDYVLNKVQLDEAIALQDTQIKYRDALAKAVDDLGENIALQKKSVQQSDELSGKLEHIRDLRSFEEGYGDLQTALGKLASVDKADYESSDQKVKKIAEDLLKKLDGNEQYKLVADKLRLALNNYKTFVTANLQTYTNKYQGFLDLQKNQIDDVKKIQDEKDLKSQGAIRNYQAVRSDITGNYYFLSPARDWSGAQAFAQSAGGNLVTINNQDEQNWLFQRYKSYVWIGLSDHIQEGVWRWVSGEPVTYTNWLPNQPDNWDGIEDFVQLNLTGDGRWNDLPHVGIHNGNIQGIVELNFQKYDQKIQAVNDKATADKARVTGELQSLHDQGIKVLISQTAEALRPLLIDEVNEEVTNKIADLPNQIDIQNNLYENSITIWKNLYEIRSISRQSVDNEQTLSEIINNNIFSAFRVKKLIYYNPDNQKYYIDHRQIISLKSLSHQNARNTFIELDVSKVGYETAKNNIIENGITIVVDRALNSRINLSLKEIEDNLEASLQKYVEQKQTNVLSTVQVSINDVNNKIYGLDTFKQAQLAYRGIFTLADGGWTDQNIFPRHLADVNGDGNADIVGFAYQGVYVALAKGDGTFGEAKLAYRGIFTVTDGGWTSQDKYPRYLADINGDGNADIVGFAHYGVEVALAKGDGTFGEVKLATKDSFTVGNGGWISQDKYPRHLADINGDGKADIVGFGQDAVYTQLSNGDGTFGNIKIATNEFSVTGGGWISQDKYPRFLADINGDGNADIVGFAHEGVYVALAKGDGTFGNAQLGYRGIFTVADGGWTSQDKYPRYLADVNGDKKSDIVGFAHQGVYIGLANGNGTFGEAQLAYRGIFTLGDGGWTNQNIYPRHLADINGDGNADIVGFAHQGVYVALNDVVKKQQEDLENLKKFNEDKAISDLQKLRLETAYLTLQAEKDPDKLQKYLQEYQFNQLTLNNIKQTTPPVQNLADNNLIGDFNNDKINDTFHHWNVSGANELYLGRSDGSFTKFINPISTTAINESPTNVFTGDFNGDNKSDLYFYWKTTGRNRLYISNGNGTFTQYFDPISTTAINGAPDYTITADFNGDGKQDAYFFWKASGINRLYISNGDGTFTQYLDPITTTLINGSPDQVQVNDFNNDGKIDIRFQWTTSNTIRTFLTKGNSIFSQALSLKEIRDQYYPDLNQADTLHNLQTQIDKEIGESEKQIEELKNSIIQKQADSAAATSQATWYEEQAATHWELSRKAGPTWVEIRWEKTRDWLGRADWEAVTVTHVDHHWIIWNTYTQQAAFLKEHSANLLQGIATDTTNQNTASEILKQWQAANAVADETALTQSQLTTLLNQLDADRQLTADKKQQIADWEKLLPTLQSQLQQAIKDAETAKNTVTQEWTEYQTSQEDYQTALGEVLTRRAQLQTQGQILLQEINAVNQWVKQQNTLLADEISQVETLITQLTTQRDAIAPPPLVQGGDENLTKKALLDQSIQLLNQKQTVLTSQQSTFIQKQTLLETQKKVIQAQYQLLDAYLDSPDNDTSSLEKLLTDTRATLLEVQKLAEQAEASSNALTALMDDVQTSLLLQNDKYLSAIKDKQQTLQDLLKAAELKENDTLKATQKQLELNNLEAQLIPILQKAKDAGSKEAGKLLEVAAHNNFATVAELYYRDYKDLASDQGGGCAGGIARPEDLQLANYYYGEMLKYRQLKAEAEAQVVEFTQIRTLADSQIAAIQQQQTLAAQELAQLNKSIGNSQEQIEAKQEELAIAQFRIDALAQIRNWTEQTVAQLLSVETLNLAQAQLEQDIAKSRQYLIDNTVKATLDKQRLDIERDRQIAVTKLEQLNQINTEKALQTAINDLRSDLGVNPLEDIIQQAEYKGQLAGILADLDTLKHQQPNLPESLRTLLAATTQDIHSALQGKEAKTIQENLLNTATALIEQSKKLNAEVTQLDQEEQHYVGLLKQSETDLKGATKALYDEIQRSGVLDKEKQLINAQNLEILYRIGYAHGAVDLSSQLAKESQQILSQIIEGRIAERKVRKKAFVNELLGTATLIIAVAATAITAGAALSAYAGVIAAGGTTAAASTAATAAIAANASIVTTLQTVGASLSAVQSAYNGDWKGAIFSAGMAALGAAELGGFQLPDIGLTNAVKDLGYQSFEGFQNFGQVRQFASGVYNGYQAIESGNTLAGFTSIVQAALAPFKESSYSYLYKASSSIYSGVELAKEDNLLGAASSFLNAVFTLGSNLSKTLGEHFSVSKDVLDIISNLELGVNAASAIKNVINNDSLEGWLSGIQQVSDGFINYVNENTPPPPPQTPIDLEQFLYIEDAIDKVNQDFQKLKESANGDKNKIDALSQIEFQIVTSLKQNNGALEQADFEAFRINFLSNTDVNIKQFSETLNFFKAKGIEAFHNAENDDLKKYYSEEYPNYKQLPGHQKAVAIMSIMTGIDPRDLSDYLPGLGITGIKGFNWYSGFSDKLLLGTALHDVTDFLDDALKNQGIESWNKSVWGISNSTVSALKMFSDAVGKEVSDVVKETVQSALKPINYTTKLLDPLIVDLSNDGLQLISLENSTTRFDIDGDGYAENTAWVSPQDGILTIDLNHDGKINNITEIFSEHYNNGTAKSGLEALATLDSNKNGIISAADDQFNQILVWQDLNQDGISQPNELKTLTQHGITSITLNGLTSETLQDGNIILTRSIFNRNDGTIGQIADVAFLVTETGFKVIQTPNGIQIIAENNSATSLSIFNDNLNHTLNLADAKVQVAIGSTGNDNFYTTASEGVFLSGAEGNDTLTGGSGNDWIIGDTGADQLFGKAGDDILYIDAQDSKIDGGEGQDIAIVATPQSVTLDLGLSNLETALGNDGNDTFTNSGVVTVVIDGGKGNDTLQGGAGDDVLNGGEGDDKLYGADGNDQLYGNEGNDELHGWKGSDTLYGGSDNDILYGQQDNDFLYGEDGDDQLQGNEGNDEIQAGNGSDSLYGGSGDDKLYGNTGNDKLYGEDGNDQLYGNEGNDELHGWDGADTMYGGADNDTLYGHQGNDSLFGDAGDDKLYGDPGDDVIQGGEGIDWLYGNVGNDTLKGNEGNDFLYGEDGNDQLSGGEGNDELNGSVGIDTLTGGEGKDVFRFSYPNESSKANPDRIEDFQPGSDRIDLPLAANINDLTITRAAKQTTITHKTLDFALILNGDIQLNSSDFIFPNSAIEAAGNTTFLKDIANKYFAQTGTTTPSAIKLNGTQIYQNIFPGWQTLAAETINGQNQILWKNTTDSYLHLWKLDANWDWQSSTGQWALNSPEAFTQESNFGIDANGDGVIGAPYTPVEAVGGTQLVKDTSNKYFAQTGTTTPSAIKLNGTQIYQNIFSGWQTFAAETINGQNQILWKNTTDSYLHLWKLDANWDWQSSTGQWALNSPEAFTQESNFGIDANGDGVIGAPYTPVEAVGGTQLVKDTSNKYFAQTGTTTPSAIKLNGTQIYQNIFSGWQTFAAETINGQNQILWKNTTDSYLHLWKLDANWDWQSSTGQWALNSPEAFTQESNFGIDANGDGVIGAPYTPVETSGSTTLLKDPTNQYFAQTGTTTPLPIKLNGTQIYQNIFPGWQTLAAETINGQNQILWKNTTDSYLHLWKLDANWGWQSSTGQWALNSPEALTQETNFGIDANGDGVIGAPYTPVETSGSTTLLKDPTNQYFAQTGITTPLSIKLNGTQIYQNIFPGWQTLAAETINGQNQILWKNTTDSYLHLWKLDVNWNWQSSTGQWPLNSPESYTQETLFQLDANGDGKIGNPASLTLTGTSSSDTLVGGGNNDILTGAGGKDILIGGGGSDRFDYKTLTDSLLAIPDIITDFNANNDLLLVTTARSGFTNAGAVTGLTVTEINAKLTPASFAANYAAQLTFATRTFVAINDATAGFNATTDALIEVTGLTGTLNLNNFVTI
jgi:Ca2+-binding RTX toxin-like protein